MCCMLWTLHAAGMEVSERLRELAAAGCGSGVRAGGKRSAACRVGLPIVCRQTIG
jgi:hypothetical protein